MRSYYEILGVPRTASQANIKTAYKRLAKIHHPDKHTGPGQKVQEDIFKGISEAYNVLTDPVKRKRYDLKLFYQENPAYSRASSTPRPAGTPAAPTPPRRKRKSREEIKAEKRTEKKAYIYSGIGLLIIFTGAIFFYFFMNNLTAKKRVEEAHQFMKQKQHTQAYLHFKEALEKDPDLAPALEGMGDVLVKMGRDPEQALSFYRSAIENSEQPSSNLLIKTANLQKSLNKPEEALKTYNYAEELYPGKDSIYFFRGDLYSTYLDRQEEALQDFDRALELKPSNIDYQFSKAIALQKLSRFRDSNIMLDKLIQKEPDQGAFYFIRAFNQINIGDTSRACVDWQKSSMFGYEFGAKRYIDVYCEN